MLFLSKRINPDPADMLWHLANAEMPCYLHGEGSDVGWVKYPHRGVQFVDKVDFPRKEKRYIFSPRFQVKYDTAFEECLAACAERPKEGHTWITPEVHQGYMNLHKLGFAHSYETWENDKLVGGGIGVQIGGFLSCDSLFHRVSNASKAAWGQLLVHAKERGFEWIDTNCVAAHHVNYGEEWVPQWKFEQMMRTALEKRPTLLDGQTCPELPWQVRYALPVARAARALARRLPLRRAAAV